MNRPERALKVLIIDDDPDDHILTESTLRDARRVKFEVEHAYTVEDAAARMRAGGFDVCLLDYALGAMDGVQLFREQTEAGYSIPTILLSGHDDEDLADQIIEAGLADYQEKSNLEASSLERAILYALDRDAARCQIVELNRSLEERVYQRTYELESFCYTVSHDLRAPLRAINATSAILKEDFGAFLPQEAQEELVRQEEASARLGKLIDDLLNFVRLGQTQVQRIDFDLSTLVKAVAQELRIEVETEPGIAANGDPTLVRLLVMNLLDNAAKFGGPDRPSIQFGSRDGVYFVRDHGIGFDPQYTHKLFRPFERLHREGAYPGTGIGLANVRRIVDRHGGQVWAESELGKGATFYFTLRAKA